MRIPLSRPSIGEREIELVTRVLRSGVLSQGPALEEFEQRFAQYVGTRYAVATSSGTAALHLAVRALGIGAGDEVITTSFTFAASVNCLLYEGALPAFVDIDAPTLNLDPQQLRQVLARDYTWDLARAHLVNRTSGRVLKAILPVHVFGVPCAMAPIMETAREFNLRVIEDACEALGSEYRGRRAGSFGDAAAFGFYPNKQITTGEGGIVVTNDPSIATSIRILRNQGRDNNAAWLRHSHLGYNYRLSDVHAAIGVAQLQRIDELLAARERVAEQYARGLANVPRVTLPWNPPGAKRSWFVYAIRVGGPDGGSTRDRLIEGLRERGIACQAYFPAVHLQPYFQQVAWAPRRPLPHTEIASERTLALPFFPEMTPAQVDEVCGAVREIIAEADHIRVSAIPSPQEAARSATR